MSLADIASGLPWPVFACGDDKRPVVETGFKAATRDTATIAVQFSRSAATMIGVPTGIASGLLAIDVDIKEGKDGRRWLEANKGDLPETRTHATRSGGLHLIFRMPPNVEIRNSAGRLAPGVDVRGEGGYIIVPPSPGYTEADPTDPAPMPEWLIKACMRQETTYEVRQRQIVPHEKYVQAAIDNEVLAVMRAGEGTRNDTLNRAAFNLGTLVALGRADSGSIITELLNAAVAAGLPYREAETTIRSGMDAGLSKPRDPPEQTTHPRQGAQPQPPIEPAKQALWAILDPWHECDIPTRPWVARGYIMRNAVNVVSGPGSAGKSSQMVGWACACAMGTSFHRFSVSKPLKVATYNVEDDGNEQKRRFSAMFKKMGISGTDLEGRLAILGPNDVGTLLTVAPNGKLIVETEVMNRLIEFVQKFQPDVLILDPFVELHVAEENDNTAVRGVMAHFRQLAITHNMGVVILHHARKGAGTPGDPESLRGASSIVGAARVAMTLNVMTDDEAKTFGISPERRYDYYRMDRAKSNYAPIEDAEWFERLEIKLDNAKDGEQGDAVAVSWPWRPPNPLLSISEVDLNRALTLIDEGPEHGIWYTATKRGGSNKWAGQVLHQILGLNDKQSEAMIKSWIKDGTLFESDYIHPQWRRKAVGVRVNASKRPSL